MPSSDYSLFFCIIHRNSILKYMLCQRIQKPISLHIRPFMQDYRLIPANNIGILRFLIQFSEIIDDFE